MQNVEAVFEPLQFSLWLLPTRGGILWRVPRLGPSIRWYVVQHNVQNMDVAMEIVEVVFLFRVPNNVERGL